MNAKQLGVFLQSMEKSCDVYSTYAMGERERLREVNSEFKGIEKSVERTLSVVKRRPPGESGVRAVSRKGRSRSQRREVEQEELVIRPAPFPVRNYILPAHQMVGPRRFYSSRAARQIREDERDEAIEMNRFPTLRRPVTAQAVELPVTVTRIIAPVYRSGWGDDNSEL
jgi:hypothetical protein